MPADYLCRMNDTIRKRLRNEFSSGTYDPLSPLFARENSCGKFFSELQDLVTRHSIDDELGQHIETLALGWLEGHSLRDFRNESSAAYGRTYLGRCPETGWEAIVMSWQGGRASSIHAHPQFAGYFFADGEFRVEIFEPAGAGRARLKKTLHIVAPHGLYAIGSTGRFDNHIHRITCLSDEGHSLHIYSDDALQGEVYELTR